MTESNAELAAATLFIVSMAALSAMVAIGIVLSIKIARRRAAQKTPDTTAIDVSVPAVPLSSLQAQSWMRRYATLVAAIVVALLVSAAVVLGRMQT